MVGLTPIINEAVTFGKCWFYLILISLSVYFQLKDSMTCFCRPSFGDMDHQGELPVLVTTEHAPCPLTWATLSQQLTLHLFSATTGELQKMCKQRRFLLAIKFIEKLFHIILFRRCCAVVLYYYCSSKNAVWYKHFVGLIKFANEFALSFKINPFIAHCDN